MKNTDTFKVYVSNSQMIDGNVEEVSENGHGSIREKNGVFYIVYKTDAASVMIKTDGRYVDLKRTGDASSHMHYEKGKSTSFDYNTPYGTIKMNVFTSSLVSCLAPDGGTLRIEYVLETGGDKLYNDIIIKIEKQKG